MLKITWETPKNNSKFSAKSEELAETNLEKTKTLNNQFSSFFVREYIVSVPCQPSMNPKWETLQRLLMDSENYFKILIQQNCGLKTIHPQETL